MIDPRVMRIFKDIEETQKLDPDIRKDMAKIAGNELLDRIPPKDIKDLVNVFLTMKENSKDEREFLERLLSGIGFTLAIDRMMGTTHADIMIGVFLLHVNGFLPENYYDGVEDAKQGCDIHENRKTDKG